jgi:hypothetical protein
MRRFVLSVLAFVLVLMVASSAYAGDAQTVNGWVSESKCGAKGASAAHEECSKKCIGAGAKPVVVTDSDQKVLQIDNPDSIKGHEGHHMSFTGHITDDKIHIDSFKML